MPYAPRLESNSLYLRGLDHEDVTETYCEWLNNPLVNRYLETRYKIQTIDDINNFITNKNQSIDERLFGIFIKEQNYKKALNYYFEAARAHHGIEKVKK